VSRRAKARRGDSTSPAVVVRYVSDRGAWSVPVNAEWLFDAMRGYLRQQPYRRPERTDVRSVGRHLNASAEFFALSATMA
jgi:hypothetical protein